MKLVAGVDIGNATTETAIARIDGKNVTFLSSGITGTTGIKGTKQNIHGVFQSLKNALDEVGFEISDLDEVRINEAAPVIGDVAMETITETIITESTMIGHNPNTPGGVGIGVGISQRIDRLDTVKDGGDVIVVIPAEVSFEAAAALINRYNKIFNITGAIVQRDDGVLINNRLEKKIPIVDEVGMIDKVPLGMLCAVEVAPVPDSVEPPELEQPEATIKIAANAAATPTTPFFIFISISPLSSYLLPKHDKFHTFQIQAMLLKQCSLDFPQFGYLHILEWLLQLMCLFLHMLFLLFHLRFQYFSYLKLNLVI